tara:strand:- start:54 stop:491 length:438 start_codon:yes stop_codon:yes gene_type:complete
MVGKIKIKRPYVLVFMCLDFLHHGHINILEKAKRKGNIILALVTNKGILSYKGKKPFIDFRHRLKIAKNIKLISLIVPSKGPSEFCKLAKKFKCEFFVHGDDWKKGVQSKYRQNLIKTMKKWGGKVIDLPYTKKISSTIIKSKLN